MKKAIVTAALAAMLACMLGLTACSSTVASTEDGSDAVEGSDAVVVESLYGIEIEGTIETVADAAEENLEVTVEFDYGVTLKEESDAKTTGMGESYTIEDEEGYDSVYDYADDMVELTYADGTEASFKDIEDGTSVTVVFDEDDSFKSIVIDE